MHKKNKFKAIIAIVVALVFIMPVAAFANDEGSTNNSGIMPEIDSVDLCPSPSYDAEDTNIVDTSDLGVLGDRFYGYKANTCSSLPIGPVYFDSEHPGTITLLKETTSPNFIAGGTWAEDTWYGCQYGNGWLWTIDEVTGDMTLIGGGGTSLNGLAYDPTTDKMYGASNTNLYTINMSNGKQSLVGPFNTGGVIVGIAFDGEGTLYAEDLATDCLYSINPLTGAAKQIGSFGINLNYAQDMAYDITWNILYLAAFTSAASGQLHKCNITNGDCTLVGDFQGCAEITGFAIPYIITQPPETPEQPEGPSEGAVGVEYTFSTRTTDPEGEQVYYKWKWDDGTYSGWLGPFDSGDTVLAQHTWTKGETYEIKVKAKDIYNHESGWSDPKTIHIVGVLEIGNISGGLFKVTVEVKNNGDIDATDVNWSIILDGGIILIGKNTSGRIGIPAGVETTISSSLIFGFGKTVVRVTVDSVTKDQDMFVFLFIIF